MASKQITLALAAFLDSPASLALDAPDRAGQRKLLEAFLAVCYDELGSAPRLLDKDSMEEAFGVLLPRRLKAKEPLAAYAAAVLEAYLDFLVGMENVPFAFEMRLGLHAAESRFLTAVAEGSTPKVAKRDTFQHGASKLGRNDPCSCGSGKKFKKCHGRGQ